MVGLDRAVERWSIGCTAFAGLLTPVIAPAALAEVSALALTFTLGPLVDDVPAAGSARLLALPGEATFRAAGELTEAAGQSGGVERGDSG